MSGPGYAPGWRHQPSRMIWLGVGRMVPRIMAFLIDGLIMFLASMVIYTVASLFDVWTVDAEWLRQYTASEKAPPIPPLHVDPAAMLVVSLATAAGLALYAALCWWRYGALPGQRVLNLQVVDYETGRRLSFRAALGRSLALFGALGVVASLYALLSFERLAVLPIDASNSELLPPGTPLEPWLDLIAGCMFLAGLWLLLVVGTAVANGQRRGMHDRLSGSLVISARRVPAWSVDYRFGPQFGPPPAGWMPPPGWMPPAGWTPPPPGAPPQFGPPTAGWTPPSDSTPPTAWTPPPGWTPPSGWTPPPGWTPPGSWTPPGQGGPIDWRTPPAPGLVGPSPDAAPAPEAPITDAPAAEVPGPTGTAPEPPDSPDSATPWKPRAATQPAALREQAQPASVGRRAAAYLVDSVFVFMLFVAALSTLSPDGTLSSSSLANERVAILSGLAGGAIQLVYFVLGWSIWKASIGQRVFGLSVVLEDGKPMSAMDALVRWAVLQGPFALVSIVPLAVSPVAMLLAAGWSAFLLYSTETDPNHQGLHDRFVKTKVVEV